MQCPRYSQPPSRLCHREKRPNIVRIPASLKNLHHTRYPRNVATSATTDHILAPVKAAPTLLSDYATLFKLRVSTMVIITAGAAFYLGSLQSGISPFHPGLLQPLPAIPLVTCRSRALT